MTHKNQEERSVEELVEEIGHHLQEGDYKGATAVLHHQLQKARQDWLREEIVRLVEVPHKGHVNYHRTNGYNQAIQNIRDRYQAELDQDVSK